MTCGKRLAPGQWWNFCGETDMGQTIPVQCTECGGEYPLASPEVQAESDRKKAERDDKFLGTYLGTGTNKTIQHSIGMQPAFFFINQYDGTHKIQDNPNYVEPPPSEPEESDDDDWQQAGAYVISACYGHMRITLPSRPAWWRRALVKIATGWTWEDSK